MRAAYRFARQLEKKNLLQRVSGIKVHLFGSLAMTGEGHGTPKAILVQSTNHYPLSL
jgi:L-serine dehydratase